MGCCQSTSRAPSPSSPYSPSNAHGDSSSRAIATASADPPASITPSTSTHPARRRVGLTEQFNEPLRPHIWTSKRKWTRRTVDREREAFFDTRVSGHQEVWRALQMVVELLTTGEIETAQGVLDAACITVPTGDLINGAYDESGNFYQMPDVVIGDPENLGAEDEDGPQGAEDEMERRREEKGKAAVRGEENYIRVKARLSDRGGPDVVVSVPREQTVRILIRRIQEEADIVGSGRVKIAYLGKILNDGKSLLAQGWREGHVINVLVFGE